MSLLPDRNVALLRAHGRCTGAEIFAVFGSCWLLTSLNYFQRLHLQTVVPVCVVALSLAVAAWWMDRSNPAPILDEQLTIQKKSDDRVFGIINGVTYTLVFLLFVLLPKAGLSSYVFPGFVALVGLHFLPMPRLYEHTANVVTGLCMVVWAVVCTILFRADGTRMAAFVALGAGLALCCSSVSAIATARQLFRTVALERTL